MSKRVMRTFKLDEISGVDNPAQVHARVTLMKRADSEPYWKRDFSQEDRDRLAGTGAAMPGGEFPIVNRSDLENAIHAIGRAKDPAKAKAHIISRAKTLGTTDALPDGWVGKAGDPDMSALKKALGLPETATEAEVMAAVDKANKAAEDAKAAQTAVTAELTKLKARLEKADMSDRHTAYMNNPKATMPKGGKAAFQAMEPGEREAHCSANPIGGGDDAEKRFNDAVAAGVAKALAGEEVIKVGETEIRKSVVGDAHFAVFKAQQLEIVKANDAREIVELQKRADTEFGQLPGESIAKAKVLKAVARMPDAERADLEKMLKGGNAALKTLMKSVGSDGGGVAGGAIEQMNAKAEAYRTGQAAIGKTLSPQQAFAKVWEDPANVELKKAYTTEENAAKRDAAA